MMGSMMRRAMIGDSATLNVDFTSMTNGGQLANAGFTFTNATTTARTYINSSGLVATATTNEPRFDHDPTTLAPKGLLIEGTATNIATNSNLQAAWLGGSNTTVTANTNEVTSPDGTNNAAKIALTNTGYCSRFESITGLANATTYTFSYWIRGTAGNQQRVYSVTQGTDLVTQSTLTYTSTGWTRVQITFTSGAVNNNVYIYVASRPSGTVNDVLYVYGCQLEAGNGASSLIPTVASTVTRLRDEVVLSSLPGIAFNQSAGTIYSQLEIVEKLRGSFVPYGSFDTSGGGRCWWWLRHNHDTSVGQRILGTAFNSGGSTAITSSNYTHSSGVFKFATSLDPVAGRMVYAIAGGSAQVTNASGFTLATAAQMSLNKNSDVAATDLGSMWVRSIKYWPTALPDATLQSMTT